MKCKGKQSQEVKVEICCFRRQIVWKYTASTRFNYKGFEETTKTIITIQTSIEAGVTFSSLEKTKTFVYETFTLRLNQPARTRADICDV